MKISTAHRIAKHFLREYCLEEWKIQFKPLPNAIATTHFGNGTITIDTDRLDVFEYGHIRTIMLHEIVHILVGPQHEHDRVFTAACYDIGMTVEDYKLLYK